MNPQHRHLQYFHWIFCSHSDQLHKTEAEEEGREHIAGKLGITLSQTLYNLQPTAHIRITYKGYSGILCQMYPYI